MNDIRTGLVTGEVIGFENDKVVIILNDNGDELLVDPSDTEFEFIEGEFIEILFANDEVVSFGEYEGEE